eukprot:g2616.t1
MESFITTLFAFAILIGLVHGEQGQHPLTNIPPPGDVQTSYVLPEHPSKQFPAGDQIPILLGFHNSASRAYNLSYILGSINLPDNNMFVQNFSYQVYFTAIKPKEEATFAYSFRPDKSLRPMELRVALTAFYMDAEGQGYASTFFNETIDIIEKPKWIDYELLWMYCVMLAMALGVIYALVSWIIGLTTTKKRTKKPTAKTDQSGSEDWLKGSGADRYLKTSSKSKTK